MSEFVEVTTQDLSGAALDWAVAQIDEVKTAMLAVKSQEAKKPFALFGSLALAVGGGEEGYSPSSCWHCGGPLIEKYGVDLSAPPCIDRNREIGWQARPDDGATRWHSGETALIAAMRSIVAAKIGNSLSVPKELV